MNITNDERLNLKKMISEFGSEDNTEHIRRVKHSQLIQNDMDSILKIKNNWLYTNENSHEQLAEECRNQCPFLFIHYTDIFNKIVKNELDIPLFGKLIEVLRMIEEGKTDQHEGSVLVGKILKKLYLDSAVRMADHLDKQRENEQEMKKEEQPEKEITWSQYKSAYL